MLLATDNVEIETDAVRLRQMVEQLLNNAAKFTVKGHMDIGYALSNHICIRCRYRLRYSKQSI